MPLSTEPYKGTRDFYPEDMAIQNHIFDTMHKVARRYGYQEYGASILEDTALYKAKSGEEIINKQTYTFIDRGEREVTIRPEMTPTVARMIAGKRKELAFPARWYSIPNLFRYEKPQRGRLREHWQLNVDIFGVESLDADVELMLIAYDIMKAFGAHDEHFIIRVNHRKLLNFLTHDVLGLDEEGATRVSKLLDRKRKMPEAEFRAEAEALLGNAAVDFFAYLSAKSIGELPSILRETQACADLNQLIGRLYQLGVRSAQFDPTLVRGFDYYTGPVFEVFDVHPQNNRSLFGGGRYDDLVGIFGVEKVPGTGFGMGDVTIRDFMETYDLLPKYSSSADLYLCAMDAANDGYIESLARELRQGGINVFTVFEPRKMAAHIKAALRNAIPWFVCVGDREKTSGMFALKHLTSETEYKETPRGALAAHILRPEKGGVL